MTRPNRRTQLLIVAVIVLVLFNIIVRVGDESTSDFAFAFDSGASLNDPKVNRVLTRLRAHPQLDFQKDQAVIQEDDLARNPFEFGIDRALQEQRRQEMEAMRQQVAQAEAIDVDEDPIPQAPAAPEFKGTLLGILEEPISGRRRVALKVDDVVYVVGPGDRVADTYSIMSVDYERIMMTHLGRGESIEVPVGEDTTRTGQW